MAFNTQNLISTPEITGNIGQCQSNATTIENTSRTNPFTINDTGWITNSCTGQTDIVHSWEFSGFSHACMWIIGLAIVCSCISFFVVKANKD